MINWMFSQKKKKLLAFLSHMGKKPIERMKERKTDAKPDKTKSNKFDATKQHQIEKLIKSKSESNRKKTHTKKNPPFQTSFGFFIQNKKKILCYFWSEKLTHKLVVLNFINKMLFFFLCRKASGKNTNKLLKLNYIIDKFLVLLLRVN